MESCKSTDVKEELAGTLAGIDRLSYVDMICMLGMEGSSVPYAGDDGAYVKMDDHLVSIASFSGGDGILSHLEDGFPLVCVHDENLRNVLVNDLGYENEEGCWSCSWWGGPTGECGHDMRTLDTSYLERIHEVYSLSDRQELERDLEKGMVTGLFVEDSLVGFIGFHREGSMGMLHVFEPYRRRGYAEVLERHDIDRALAMGLIPYCHVFFSNRASLALQAKLGLERGSRPIWWLWRG